MSNCHLPLASERRGSRAGTLALLALVLLGACATGAPSDGRQMAYRDPRPTPRQSSETRGLTKAVGGEEGNSALIFARLPTDFAPVRIGDAEFKAALVKQVLDMPLRVASSAPVRRGGRLAPGSGGSGGDAWQSDLVRSYGRYCEQRRTPGDCFSLFNDGPYLQDDDKRSIAMALAVGPALEGVDAELRAMLDPTRVLATVSISLSAYMALLVAPEPASGHLC
ncbi:hypothetical protein F0U61_29265 [Archangium violaceum]|uniref:hypothetical protein n=1 Tax=Archangium violaceum TaxID=83451 RepID=UPI002B2B8A56|nr:hypothetical protein F0U61_29265 [Archangium violaceum]